MAISESLLRSLSEDELETYSADSDALYRQSLSRKWKLISYGCITVGALGFVALILPVFKFFDLFTESKVVFDQIDLIAFLIGIPLFLVGRFGYKRDLEFREAELDYYALEGELRRRRSIL